jgi:predicted acyl esterase
MQNNSYATNYSYLKLAVRPRFPKIIQKLMFFLMRYGSLPIVKILGSFFGHGFPKYGVKRYPEYMLSLKDGTRLATDIYVPKNIFKKRGKCSTILIRLPYWKDSLSILAYTYASYGYVVVMQDIRGCAHSEGFNFYLFNEREDGLETLEWIKKQYWYNGKIGMAGASYFGLTQLVLSWDNEILTCISPAISSTLNLWRDNGGLELNSLTTSIYKIMVNIVANKETPAVDILTREMQERYLNPKSVLFNDKIDFQEEKLRLSELKGKNLEQIQEIMINHYKVNYFSPNKKNYKIYFKFLNDFLINRNFIKDDKRMSGFLDLNMQKFSQPAFLLAGWQDMFLEKQLEDFLDIKANATGFARNHSKIIIGSWAHAAVGHPDSVIFNAGILGFFKELINLKWFDYWLQGNKDAFREINKPSIKYWVMGKNIWRYTEVWPPKNVKYGKLYLHSNGNANSIRGDGRLDFQEPEDEWEDAYLFDPMNPVITKGGRNLGILKGARNQKDAEKREDVLVYSSEKLKKGIEITGNVEILLYAASSAKDTDFMVKLVDVFPNGIAYNILDAGIRARYRDGENHRSLIKPGEIYKYRIKLGNTSNYFRENHRIRIEITSSNFPRFDINSNLGGEKNDKGYIIANQKIYHNNRYSSHLILPIYMKNEKLF